MTNKSVLCIIQAVMLILAGNGWPAGTDKDKLQVISLETAGQQPAARQNIPGPKELSFPLPRPGKALNITGRLGTSNAVWKIILSGDGKENASLTMASPGKLDKYDTLHLDKHKQYKTEDEASLALVRSVEASMNVELKLDGKPVYSMPYFLKPKLGLYTGENQRSALPRKPADPAIRMERDQVAARYPQFPSALTEPFTVKLENNQGKISLWLNGRFLAILPDSAKQAAASLTLAKGNELLNACETPALAQGPYLPLELQYYARPGFAPYVQPEKFHFVADIPGLKPEAPNTIAGLPMFCLSAKNNIDVGLSRWLEEELDPGDFYDKDGSRCALDGCPESIILQVPKENYIAAHVLCAVEPNPEKTPVLTLHVTRFQHRGRGDAYADTTVYLPGSPADPLPANIKKAGEIRAGGTGMGAQATELPVYLVEVPLKMGEITDLLGADAAETTRRGNKYLDIELTKEIRPAVNLGMSRRKPLGLASAVHVFALTLERNPVDVQVASKEHGNIFYAADNPAFNIRFTNTRDKEQNLKLTWEITDFYGNKKAKSLPVTVPETARNNGRVEAKIPLARTGSRYDAMLRNCLASVWPARFPAPPGLGYFDILIAVKDEAGRELWRQPASFALLPPDTRQAGAESPYGIWVNPWPNEKDMSPVGLALKKMGIRHISPLATMAGYSEKDLAHFGLSFSMAPAPRLAKISAIAEWKKQGLSAAEIEKRKREIVAKDMQEVEEFLAKNPSVRLGMIFWERHVPGTEQPYPELLGKPKPELTEAGKAAFNDLWDHALAVGEFYRTKHPQIKITLGNSPSALMVWFMRQGFPKKYIDCFGMELSGVDSPPEAPPYGNRFQDVWFVREMQKIYGYEEIPVSAGAENVYHPVGPGHLTLREQADFYARDALHSLAYGFASVKNGGFEDVYDGYYNTQYGPAGFVRRMPLNYPKPAYVAYATLTLVLDGAKYERYLDMGANSLYVLEFKRGRERIYPIWTLRGKRQVTLTIANGRDTRIVDSMGNASRPAWRGNCANLEAATSPKYLLTSGKIEQVSAGQPAYPEDVLPLHPVVLSKFDSPSELEMETPDSKFTKSAFYGNNPWCLQGNFQLSAVADPEKGKVTELVMEPQPAVPRIAAKYVALRFKNPVIVEKEFRRLGIWVKGNSCWGNVCWEFWDANGERYISKREQADAGEHSASINFDDWCFISMEIPKRFPGGYRGCQDQNWHAVSGDKDGVVQFPIKIMWTAVAMREWQVYVTNMIPARSRSIRLGPLVAGD